MDNEEQLRNLLIRIRGEAQIGCIGTDEGFRKGKHEAIHDLASEALSLIDTGAAQDEQRPMFADEALAAVLRFSDCKNFLPLNRKKTLAQAERMVSAMAERLFSNQEKA